MSPTERKFDVMLTAALERRPEIAVPENFAARIVASLPAVRPAQRTARVTHYGRTAAYLCMLLLTAGLVALPILRPASILNLGSGAALLEIAFTLELMLLLLCWELWQAY